MWNESHVTYTSYVQQAEVGGNVWHTPASITHGNKGTHHPFAR